MGLRTQAARIASLSRGWRLVLGLLQQEPVQLVDRAVVVLDGRRIDEDLLIDRRHMNDEIVDRGVVLARIDPPRQFIKLPTCPPEDVAVGHVGPTEKALLLHHIPLQLREDDLELRQEQLPLHLLELPGLQLGLTARADLARRVPRLQFRLVPLHRHAPARKQDREKHHEKRTVTTRITFVFYNYVK